MNQFVATNDDGTEGLLFTNIETSPGNVVRMPISQNEDGTWSSDLENTINLSNTEELRSIGGTRINCYGDLSPWNTALSAEEEYAHPRVSNTSTVSDIIEDGTGVGHRGAAHFWNRPNPSEIQEAIDEYYGNDAWEVQGAFALSGVELHAYYLGADPVDQEDGSLENTLTPIGEGCPTPYRTGYIVDFRDPEAEVPQPVKYHVMGRAAWEAPNVQTDQQTVYLTSDGVNKGLYKFIADRPISDYENPMDLEGTLYAAKVTNQEAAAHNPPAEVNLELEWIELGHACNYEVESWIAEYDDIDQEDYLEHAGTDWEEDLETALEEADREVAENGNNDYVSDKEIVEWADQYGGIQIFDTSDFDNVEQVGYISPPNADVGLRTAHNFDVTQNRIHTSWYNGGVQVHDITDETDPEKLFSDTPEGYSVWTAVQGRGFTLGGIYGARSDASNGGVAFLHADRGQRRAPSFDGSAPPRGPEVEMNIDEGE